MNIYDTANQLAGEIRISEEYVNYKMAREAISMKVELKEKIKEFEEARFDAQITAMQTGKNDEAKMQKAQDLYGELIQQEEAKKYFEAEMKFNILIADVNKIIGDSIKDVMN